MARKSTIAQPFDAAPPQGDVALVWFAAAKRLSDHAALVEAARESRALVCLYIFDDTLARPPGAASRWWLAQSLRALDASLREHGQTLVLRRGDPAFIIDQIAREIGAARVLWNRPCNPPEMASAMRVIKALTSSGIKAETFPGDLLIEPHAMIGKEGRAPRVFTPFWKRVCARGDPPDPLPAPATLPPPVPLASGRLDDWHFEPRAPDWAASFRDVWQPGESGARQRLVDFLDHDLQGYANLRDRPDRNATSRLSPHLRFGEISPRQVWHAAQFSLLRHPAMSTDIAKFLAELGWREFSYHLLAGFPHLHEKNLQAHFDHFPWRTDKAGITRDLKAWQRGQTGYPIVDAGMRELWTTGTMHNRVRMVVASFLIKHLLIDWRAGEAWFWDTLLDADPASNPASWQWVAGSGADAAPYFRIFNPVLQGEKFDPDGDYVRRFVPELANLPAALIHQPWDATPLELASFGVTLGKTYPTPMIDHRMARQRALDAYAKMKIAR
jgi:deoxyribodipyrimidine photo-lyase